MINPNCPAHVLLELLESIVSGLHDPLVNTDKINVVSIPEDKEL